MERMTTQEDGGQAVILPGQLKAEGAAGFVGPAAQRLAAFEAVWQQLLEEQGELAAQLEQLRAQGRKNTARFKELLGKKLAGQMTLSVFMAHGLR